jgi:four helix bundle protein
MTKPQEPSSKEVPTAKYCEPQHAAEGSKRELKMYPKSSQGGWELQEAATGESRPYDLEERTAQFGEAIIRFCKSMPRNPVNNRIIDQLVGCGTSIGANYCEADNSVSKRDFRNRIGTCRKEAKETKHFLRMAATAEPAFAEEARRLWREAREIHLIFCAIYIKGGKE